MKAIRTVYKTDGTVRREVSGVTGAECISVVAPFNRHLPEGYEVTPTAEFYEELVGQEERQREAEAE